VATATALDDVADVVLVEPRDTFVHNVAALRGLVDPAWTHRLFLPFDRLLKRGRVLHEKATRVDPIGATFASGARLAADYIELATGSGYPFPAKVDVHDRSSATAEFRVARHALAGAERVLLLGAGPVGLELAGEIAAAWADKTVTIVDPADDVLAGSDSYPPEFRAELRRQLDGMGVEFTLGTSLREPPPLPPVPPTRSPPPCTRGSSSPPTSGSAASGRRRSPTTLPTSWRPPGRPTAGSRSRLSCACPARNACSPSATSPRPPRPSGAAQIRDRAVREGNGLLDRDILDAETTMQLKSADLMVGRYTRLLGLA
jgi:hypothetical protein